MTKRICLLGNSHLAALRSALDKSPDRWPGLQVDCVGAHKDKLLETDCVDGVLTPNTDDARDSFAKLGCTSRVPLDDYDAIIITGCQVACSRAGFLYRRARWAALPSVTGRAHNPASAWTLVSQGAFQAMLADLLRNCLGGQLIPHLQRGTQTPIYLTSQPRSTSGVRALEKHALSILNQMIGNGDAATVSQMFDTTAAAVCADLGAQFLPQPRQTILDHVLTKDAFTKGAIRLTGKGRYPQPPDDVLHANAAYGTAVLNQIATTLGVGP